MTIVRAPQHALEDFDELCRYYSRRDHLMSLFTEAQHRQRLQGITQALQVLTR